MPGIEFSSLSISSSVYSRSTFLTTAVYVGGRRGGWGCLGAGLVRVVTVAVPPKEGMMRRREEWACWSFVFMMIESFLGMSCWIGRPGMYRWR